MTEARRQWGVTSLLVVLALASFLYPNTPGDKSDAVKFLSQLELAAVVNRAYPVRQLNERTQLAGCVVENGLPDPTCTPGGVFAEATAEQICVRGYASSMRSVSASLKRRVYEAYHLPYPPSENYAVDHLISLQLGGNNDIANLFPLLVAGTEPGYYKRDKDLIENYLHDEVCAGRINLSAAQMQIATDWRAVYEAINSEKREQLRKEYAQRWQN